MLRPDIERVDLSALLVIIFATVTGFFRCLRVGPFFPTFGKGLFRSQLTVGVSTVRDTTGR